MRVMDGKPDRGNVFRPGLLWRAVNSAAGAAMVTAGVVLGLAAETPAVSVLSLLMLVPGGLMTVRAWIAEVAFDADVLRVRGVLWSRAIPRDRIDQVDVDGFAPCVHWRTSRGHRGITPLTALARGETVLPSSSFARGDRFLRRLSSWAG